jgi:rhamnosyltransferase
MRLETFFEQILVVVVLYKRSLKDSEAYASLKPLLERFPNSISLFIYDNGPEKNDPGGQNIVYRFDFSNAGVSTAYNAALRYAKSKGFKFLLLLDQDTSFSITTLQAYSQAVDRWAGEHVFVPVARSCSQLISPFYFSRGMGRSLNEIKPGRHSLRNLKAINSGMLISVDAFEKCEGYDEKFGLDLSDIVFCERLANHDYSLILIDAAIQHRHSAQDTDIAQLKIRFEKYLKALMLYRAMSNMRGSYWLGGFPRAVNLARRHRDVWYIKKFFQMKHEAI